MVLDCPLDVCFTYIYQYEPYLKDPVGFPRVMVSQKKNAELNQIYFIFMLKVLLFMQMLVYLFYALPLLTFFVYGLNTPGCSWMLDLTIFFAGAMSQVVVLPFWAFL